MTSQVINVDYMRDNFRNKKVLVFGLGLLGGGLATTNWFLKQGAKVTVTDLKPKEKLTSSLRKIRGKVRLVLGMHRDEDFRNNDIIAVNPDIPPTNHYFRVAQKAGKRLENDTTLFYEYFDKPIVGVTGTRGKTTTVWWANHFLKAQFHSTIAGNSSDFPYLKILDQKNRFDIAVAETPSYQLELFSEKKLAPDVAVITNIYVDHLNFHGTEERYALAKANIFKYQTKDQHVVLNWDNAWTKKFLVHPPKSQVWLFSAKGSLPSGVQGVLYKNGALFFQYQGKQGPPSPRLRWTRKICEIKNFAKERGEHNLENLLASSLAAYLAGVSWLQISERIGSLPEVPFRQEVIYKSKQITIINDTTATSPEGCIAAVRRFGGPHTVLIAGGTDRNLDFKDWGRVISKFIRPQNLILLEGSATVKMLAAIGGKYGQTQEPQVLESLAKCFQTAVERSRLYSKSVVLFSPGAKSFGLFANEFDRGKQFTALVKRARLK